MGKRATTGAAPARRARGTKYADLVAQRIVREIVERDLQPGAMLDPEKEMLERYKVARGTLREALRHLELVGALTMRTGPGGGPMVAMPGAGSLASSVTLLLTLSRATFRDVVDLAVVLAPTVAATAAEVRRPDDVAALRESLERLRGHLRAREDDAFLRENRRFHDLLAAATGNRLLRMTFSALQNILSGTEHGVTYSHAQMKITADTLTAIVDAVERGDAAAARATAQAHRDAWRKMLGRDHPEALDRPVRWGGGTPGRNGDGDGAQPDDGEAGPRSKYAQVVAQRVIAEIIERDLPPGTMLPSERDMLARYGVGRGTLREALRHLELQGALQMRPGPGGGPMVATPGAGHLASSLALLLTLSRTRFREVVDVASALAPAIARLAAEHATRADVVALRACLAQLADDLRHQDHDAFMRGHERIQELLATAGGNGFLAVIWGALQHIVNSSQTGVRYSNAQMKQTYATLAATVDAVDVGDAARAAEVQAELSEAWRRMLARQHPDALDRPVRWGDAADEP